MIPYVHTRLRDWAAWSWMRVDGLYGPSGSQFDYDDQIPGMASLAAMGLDAHLRCIETDEAVAWLYLEDRGLGSAVMLHFRDHPNWGADMQAEMLRIAVRTLWWRLSRAQTLLLGYFLDRACGIVPQTEGLRLAKRRNRESVS